MQRWRNLLFELQTNLITDLDEVSPFSSMNPVILFIQSPNLFLIDFQQTPLKFTFIYKKHVPVVSCDQLP